MKKQKRFSIKDKYLSGLLRKGGRKGARKDFYELLRRAAIEKVSQKNE